MMLLLLLLAAPTPSPVASGQRAFDAAIKREAAGDYAGAAADLENLARQHPDDTFADDALFEAALLAEERLGDPAHAARLYGEVVKNYPQSRLARRARTRVEFYASGLRTGEAPLAEFQRLMSQGVRDPVAAIADMEKLLAQHPDFVFADHALYWLGSRLVEQGRESEGVQRFLDLERRFPSSEWTLRAKKARADLLLKRGHGAEARRLYEELARSPDSIARAAGSEGLGAVETRLWRRWLVGVGLAWLALFLGFQLWAGRRRLLRAPTELLYYLPVAALFTLAGVTENRAIGWATGGIAFGGAVITWIAGAATPERKVGGPERLVRALALALAVLALAFIAIQWAGLTDLVMETMRAGPER
jgi:outer membrane protein assembly factor BamD (BamD/ComL family)